MTDRVAEVSRTTKETKISLKLNLDGEGLTDIKTGIGFLDHMLTALGKHARFDLELSCKGDLEVDDHHTAEDCALALGSALKEALGDKKGITRFGYAYAPLDEALSRAVLDFSGRAFSGIEMNFVREYIGEIATENITHVFVSMAQAAQMTLHLDVLKGENDHHRAESAFKALALALKQAVKLDGTNDIPSTKGAL